MIELQDARKTSPFMQYALYAAHEALNDAKWHPVTEVEKERTVGSMLHECAAVITHH